MAKTPLLNLPPPPELASMPALAMWEVARALGAAVFEELAAWFLPHGKVGL